MPDFEKQVIDTLGQQSTALSNIQGRLASIELRVSGADGDPNNKGIFGKLKAVDVEIEQVNKRQRRVTDDVRIVKGEQDRQKAWLHGLAAGLTVTGVTGVLTALRMFNVVPF